MGAIARKIITSVLGVVLVLGWWTLRDRIGCGPNAKSGSSMVSTIPTKVWEGGGGTVTVETETTEPAMVSMWFETKDTIDAPTHRHIEANEKIDAGKRTFTIEVPPHISGSASIFFPDPKVVKVGTTIRIKVIANEQVIGEDSSTLDKPLEPGYAMGVEVRVDDFSDGKRDED